MKVSSQLHVPAALPPGKEPPAPIGYFSGLEPINIISEIQFTSQKTKYILKSIIFSDITTCSPSKVKRRFGVTYRFHPQGWKNKPSKQRELCLPPAFKLVFSSAYSSTLKMEEIIFLVTCLRPLDQSEREARHAFQSNSNMWSFTSVIPTLPCQTVRRRHPRAVAPGYISARGRSVGS
jgi:hypothetical protein